MELALFVIFVAIFISATIFKNTGLADPGNKKMINYDQKRDEISLTTGPATVFLVRQSGNLDRELGDFVAPFAAINEIEKAFRRAKIESVYVRCNTSDRFDVVRLHHSHRGRAEGKKLGGARIERI